MSTADVDSDCDCFFAWSSHACRLLWSTGHASAFDEADAVSAAGVETGPVDHSDDGSQPMICDAVCE